MHLFRVEGTQAEVPLWEPVTVVSPCITTVPVLMASSADTSSTLWHLQVLGIALKQRNSLWRKQQPMEQMCASRKLFKGSA